MVFAMTKSPLPVCDWIKADEAITFISSELGITPDKACEMANDLLLMGGLRARGPQADFTGGNPSAHSKLMLHKYSEHFWLLCKLNTQGQAVQLLYSCDTPPRCYLITISPWVDLWRGDIDKNIIQTHKHNNKRRRDNASVLSVDQSDDEPDNKKLRVFAWIEQYLADNDGKLLRDTTDLALQCAIDLGDSNRNSIRTIFYGNKCFRIAKGFK